MCTHFGLGSHKLCSAHALVWAHRAFCSGHTVVWAQRSVHWTWLSGSAELCAAHRLTGGGVMEDREQTPEQAFEKDAFQLTVDDVYDISYVIGRDLMKIGTDSKGTSTKVSELQFKIVRVLEVLESLVNQSSLTMEELQIERDNLKAQVEKLLLEGTQQGQQHLGSDKMVIDLADPNRPRFTLQELRDVLQERNHLKAQLLIAQEELQCYKSGIISPSENPAVTLENESAASKAATSSGSKEEKTIIKRFFSFK